MSDESFARRVEPADLPELMDEPCSYEEFRDCLHDLAQVNRFTRAYTPTLAFLDRIAARRKLTGGLMGPLRILDVGSGGGDMLRHVAMWARERGVAVEMTGIDLNPYAARAAREFGKRARTDAEIRWMTGDVFGYAPPEEIDVVMSSLFTHHLSSEDVVRFLRWMEERARLGWYVNDLERSARAARWFRVLPVIMRWHRFVRHDGPVSLRRAFREEDWRCMLAEAGVPEGAATVERHLMARMCVARMR
ncbi:MAG TPA: methyltransferase domain-containing protein [Acidobacteriaceae bacterium]|nr:methyltransferase domain-containing protein [Acidobacteriaceae bacterium]